MTSLEVRGEGVVARVDVRGGALAPIAPPPSLPDVSRLPGASMVGVASDDRAGTRVVLGCLRAPSDKWVPGIESVLFERATPMILGAASLQPALRRAPGPTIAGATFTEAHRGREAERDVRVVHAIAFAGPDADVVACSLACRADDDATCDAVASSFVVEGELVPEPPPGLLARMVLGAAERPVLALAVGGAVGVALVAVLLATRPRLRPVARRRRLRGG